MDAMSFKASQGLRGRPEGLENSKSQIDQAKRPSGQLEVMRPAIGSVRLVRGSEGPCCEGRRSDGVTHLPLWYHRSSATLGRQPKWFLF